MRIYLDHAATTPLRQEAREAMLPFLEDSALMGNPSSQHAEGFKAARLLEQFHDRAATFFACKGNDVVFNSGASEGNSHVIIGSLLLLKKPVHVAISAVEHKAGLLAAERLTQLGGRQTIIPVDGNGVVQLEFLEKLITSDRPDLVSVMAVNNETGVVQPVGEISQICREHGVLVHCDAVQSVGNGFSETLRNPDIDFLTCTAHKFGGPRGIGLLIQRGHNLPSLICGGPQEHGCRAGTENLAGIAGMIAALELAEENLEKSDFLHSIRSGFESSLLSSDQQIVIHGIDANRAPHICSFAIPGIKARRKQKELDRSGFSVGLGSACTGCNNKVSHVLEAMGIDSKTSEETLRISFGWSTLIDDVFMFEENLGLSVPQSRLI
ncbi:MAG: cysteine desulfurase [Planctomycetales bacterium]|nr:MAG: cysteine desulfurase [Planctomycetales bacterium]